MAKQLLLVRHGKSDRGYQQIKDFDRPLNHKGNKNAVCMAEKLLKKHHNTELIVSSPANRALSTAKHFARVWNMAETAIQTNQAIYESDTADLLTVLNDFSNEYNSVALFGHNPGITDFVNYLSDANISNIPTSGSVLIEFNIDDWAEASYHTGTMLLFDFPKNTEEPV